MHLKIDTQEINYLIYRYLKEAGLVHSAFLLKQEAKMDFANISHKSVEKGALVSHLKRALVHKDVETHMKTKRKCIAPLSLTEDHVCGFAENKKEPKKGGPKRLLSRKERKTQTELGRPGETATSAWSPTEPLLVSGSWDTTARLWHVSPSMEATCVPLEQKEDGQITAVAFSSDGALVATGTYKGTCTVWKKNGDLLHVLENNTQGAETVHGPVFALRWCPEGDTLLAGTEHPAPLLWAGSLCPEKLETAHTRGILAVDWRDKDTFAAGSRDGLVSVYRKDTPAPLLRLEGHTNEINSLRWSPDSRKIATASDDGTARVWDGESGDCLFVHEEDTPDAGLFSVSWAVCDSKTVLVLSFYNTTVRILDSDSYGLLLTLGEDRPGINTTAICPRPGGACLLGGASDCTIRQWCLRTGKQESVHRIDGPVADIKWSCNTEMFSACTTDGRLFVLKTARNPKE
ncbi:MAG: F-box-like/WD repeat-containing protein TBL1X-like [Amphiamblys sp. WSBS2006]|nr:MAG: F-box-like/WD repeat-containing protein TBL1X-like [Amphiamblys sp. WSBS2006]